MLPTFENAPFPTLPEQVARKRGTCELAQRQLDFRLLPHLGGETISGMRCVWNVEDDVGASCFVSEIAQRYAATPHILWLKVSTYRPRAASKGGYVPGRFGILDIDF